MAPYGPYDYHQRLEIGYLYHSCKIWRSKSIITIILFCPFEVVVMYSVIITSFTDVRSPSFKLNLIILYKMAILYLIAYLDRQESRKARSLCSATCQQEHHIEEIPSPLRAYHLSIFLTVWIRNWLSLSSLSMT